LGDDSGEIHSRFTGEGKCLQGLGSPRFSSHLWMKVPSDCIIMKYLLNYYLEMKPQISDDDEDNDLRRLATNIKEKKYCRRNMHLSIYVLLVFIHQR
jgi:hypothetical protein